MSVYALPHGKKKIGTANPGLTEEGVDDLYQFEFGELGAIFYGANIQYILRGFGDRFKQTLERIKSSFLPDVTVQRFSLLGTEYSRIDLPIEEHLRPDLKVEYTETIVTGPKSEPEGIIEPDEILWLDDPRLKGVSWFFVDCVKKNFPNHVLLICSREFMWSLGVAESKSATLWFLDPQVKEARRIWPTPNE